MVRFGRRKAKAGVPEQGEKSEKQKMREVAQQASANLLGGLRSYAEEILGPNPTYVDIGKTCLTGVGIVVPQGATGIDGSLRIKALRNKIVQEGKSPYFISHGNGVTFKRSLPEFNDEGRHIDAAWTLTVRESGAVEITASDSEALQARLTELYDMYVDSKIKPDTGDLGIIDVVARYGVAGRTNQFGLYGRVDGENPISATLAYLPASLLTDNPDFLAEVYSILELPQLIHDSPAED